MIESRHADHVAWLTLVRPERGNALAEEMVEALIAAVDSALADTTVHTLVLDAQGAHFCTGFDLGELPAGDAVAQTSGDTAHQGSAATDGPLLWRFTRIEHLLALLWHAPLRTVALARGRVWGAGADLFATCDLRLATPEAQWRFPGAGFGLVLGTRRLAALVGQPQALAWVAEGRRIDAGAALAAGLASEIVPELPADIEALPALAVDRATYARLKAATRPDLRDADLAALVRSAAMPGLATRVQRFRQAAAQARAAPR